MFTNFNVSISQRNEKNTHYRTEILYTLPRIIQEKQGTKSVTFRLPDLKPPKIFFVIPDSQYNKLMNII